TTCKGSPDTKRHGRALQRISLSHAYSRRGFNRDVKSLPVANKKRICYPPLMDEHRKQATIAIVPRILAASKLATVPDNSPPFVPILCGHSPFSLEDSPNEWPPLVRALNPVHRRVGLCAVRNFALAPQPCHVHERSVYPCALHNFYFRPHLHQRCRAHPAKKL